MKRWLPAAADRGIDIVCQKPLAPSLYMSRRIVDHAARAGVRFMVHENFRWQPWYRAIKKVQTDGAIGEFTHVSFQMRMGDGWAPDAYLARQPFFRDYPRLLLYETGVHFIDTFRYLLGEVTSVFAQVRRLKAAIKGEDAGQLFLRFSNGATAMWDANRYNEVEAQFPRYTFGTLRPRRDRWASDAGHRGNDPYQGARTARARSRLPAGEQELRGRLCVRLAAPFCRLPTVGPGVRNPTDSTTSKRSRSWRRLTNRRPREKWCD